MPHSGGGGSHGGGSHSSHSSHSGGSSSRPRISNSYYSGANRYIWYSNNRPHVYYATKRYNPKADVLGTLFFSIIWLFMSTVLLLCFVTISSGGPLELNYDTAIVIEDNANLLENKNTLTQKLTDFQKKSGVTVSVITCPTSSPYFGDDTENQSYNCYVEHFADESHWLIYYVGDAKDRSDAWSWNLMCGDDCVRVLNTKQEDNFTNQFHRNLAARQMSFDECITDALDQLTISTKGGLVYRDGTEVNGESASGQPIGFTFYIFVLIFEGTGIALLVSGIRSLVRPYTEEELQKANATKTSEAKSQLVEAQCEYCNGIYYVGTVTSCPHCAAPVKLHNVNENF